MGWTGLSKTVQNQLSGTYTLKNAPVLYKPPTKVNPYGGKKFDQEKGQWLDSTVNFTLADALSWTGAGSLATIGGALISYAVPWVADKATDGGYSEAVRRLNEKSTRNSSTPAPSVQLPESVLNPWAPGEFQYNDDNAPSLMAGSMQSAEMITLALGSLTQIISDNHVEDVQIRTAETILRYEHGERIASSLEAIFPVLLGVVETLNLPTLSESLGSHASALSGAILEAKPEINVNNSANLDTSPIVEAMQKSDNAFRQTYISTGEFWSRADSATVKYNRMTGVSQVFDQLPSGQYLAGETTLISNMVNAGDSQTEIIAAIESYRLSHVGSAVYALTVYGTDASNSQDELNQSMKNYYDNALNPDTSVEKHISQSLADIAEYSRIAKVREEFLQTEKEFKDSDGDTLVSASPMEVSAMKEAQALKNLDDKNTFKYDEDDFNSPFDSALLVPFIGRQDVYNPDHQEPSENPFLTRLKNLFPSLF